MNNPPRHFICQFTREWRVRKPYVYRYMDRKYVDRFFEDGSLRLSSFSSFAKHSDEERQDEAEGSGMVVHVCPDGDAKTMTAMLGQGENAYVLCGSTLYEPELAETFGCDSGFRINDTT